MAGGWDGDALAGQMEDALDRAQEAQQRPNFDDSTPAERAVRARRESLRLSHSRTKQQLEHATNPAHRAMLEKALHALTTEMDACGSED